MKYLWRTAWVLLAAIALPLAGLSFLLAWTYNHMCALIGFVEKKMT